MNPTLQGGGISLNIPSAPTSFSTQATQGGAASALQGGGNISVQNGASPQTTINPQAGASNVIQNPAGGVIPTAAPPASTPANNLLPNGMTVDQLYAQILAGEKQVVANTQPFQGNIDINALQSQAQASAGAAVNPLYTNYMNQYLQGLAGQAGSSDVNTLLNAANTGNYSGLNGAAEVQNAMNLQQEQAALGNTLAVNTQAQNYAGQQNAATQGNINAQAANYQQQSALANNAKIQALQAAGGAAGLGASGYGQGQLWQAENARNVADAQQQGQFQYQRNTSNMSTQDTFAQLAQSSAYAQTGEQEQETQTNFNLNNYLRQAAASDQSAQEQIQTAQQNAINAATSQYMSQNVTNALAPYQSNPQQYGMGMQQYASYLNPSSSMAAAPDIGGMISQLGIGSNV